jgi:hypothetical protein
MVCLVAGDRITDNIESGDHAQLPFTAALFVLPVLYAVPRTRGLVSRCRWPVLAVQAALTVTGFAVFGGHWQIGIDGLLAALVLLMVPRRRVRRSGRRRVPGGGGRGAGAGAARGGHQRAAAQ